MTVVEDRVRHQPTDREAEQVRWLEELWARSPDVADPRPAGLEPRPTRSREAARTCRWLLPVLLLAWPAFLIALYSIAPAPAESAATPAWAQALGAGMAIALFFTLAGFARASLGYGASAVAAGFGVALGIGCFAGGHTGVVPTFQLTGFAVLVGFSLAALSRSRRA